MQTTVRVNVKLAHQKPGVKVHRRAPKPALEASSVLRRIRSAQV
jgi:hypothetical protein